MEIRSRQVRELFENYYYWVEVEDIQVRYNADLECPYWEVALSDDGLWRTFKIKIDVEDVK